VEAGELATPAQRRTWLEAQLQTQRGARALRDAHRAWLHVASITPLSKDPGAAPEFTPAVVSDMFAQFDRFVAESFAMGPKG